MCSNWRKWCRLCGLQDGSDLKPDALTQLSAVAQKHFSLPSADEWPKVICSNCTEYLLELDNYAERCIRACEMFSELDKSSSIGCESISIRIKYGLFAKKGICSNDQDETNDFNIEWTAVTGEPLVSLQYSSFMNKEEKSANFDEEIRSHSEISDISAVENQSNPVSEKTDRNNPIRTSDVDQSKPKHPKRKIESISLDPTKKSQKITEPAAKSSISFDNNSTIKPSGKILPYKSNLKKATNSDPIVCTLCHLAFRRTEHYVKHMRTYHTAEDLPLVCLQCPKRFAISKQLELHIRAHLPVELKCQHPCPHCGKRFTKATTVTSHIQTQHLGVKPFVCEVCGKCCSTKGALMDHKLSHTDEKSVQCAQCPKMFKSRAKAKEHENNTHSGKKYECPQCDALLANRQSLREHMVVHLEEKRYKCQQCGNGYKRSHALKSHLVLHTGLRPFACTWCDKTYANSSNCYNHKKKCHPEEFYANHTVQLNNKNMGMFKCI